MVGEDTGPHSRMRLFTGVDGICERIRLQRWMSLFRPAFLCGLGGPTRESVLHCTRSLGALSGGTGGLGCECLAPLAALPLRTRSGNTSRSWALPLGASSSTSLPRLSGYAEPGGGTSRPQGSVLFGTVNGMISKGGPMGVLPCSPPSQGQGRAGFRESVTAPSVLLPGLPLAGSARCGLWSAL